MKLYRVFPWIEKAAVHEPGGVFFVPPQGTGRIDNPDHYGVLYASDSAAGSIAETFNRNPYGMHWTPRMLRPRLPGAVTALAEITPRVPDSFLCDLDKPQQLVTQTLRPSNVITRERTATQAWALGIFEQQRFAGVRWWSYHESHWGSIGLWDIQLLLDSIVTMRPLSLDDDSLQEAAKTLSISIDIRR
jgi:hypothetical protein